MTSTTAVNEGHHTTPSWGACNGLQSHLPLALVNQREWIPPRHISYTIQIIFYINLQDMVRDTEVLTRAGTLCIHIILQKGQVRWAGHVTRMSDDRLPKQLLYGELCYGKRSLGGQKKRFKDTIKKTLTSFNIEVTNWEVCAQDRPLWRSMIHAEARTAETNRIAEAQKSALLAKRDFTLPPALQPARHTHAHAPSVEECCRLELD